VKPIVVRDLGRRPLPEVWQEMKAFTEERDADSADELWFVEHPPVFTLGLNADRAHVLAPADIPVVQIDRGGQVTYHGPGQLVCYALLDIKRRQLGIRSLVQTLESAVIDSVAVYGIQSYPRRDAPGVYVAGKKLAAVGLRVRRGCSYHGIAVNVNMDLEPFTRINPCGFDDLEVTQIRALTDIENIEKRFRADFEARLLERLAG
jgi:lipoyl(octanoyl) transferase